MLLATAAAAPTVLHTRVPSGWRVAAPAPLEQPHRVTIALHQRNVDQLQRRLSQLSDPTHAVYGQWMSKAEVDDLIAPPASVVSTVTAWVQSAGISSSSITHHGDALEVVTTVGHVNALFSTSLHTFEQQGSGKRSVVAHNISMPEHVAPHVQMLLGVHNFPFPIKHSAHVISGTAHTTSSAASSSSSSSSSTTARHRFRPAQATLVEYPIMVPRDLAAYYGFPDNTQFGRPANYRANTSVALVQFDNNYESIAFTDIAAQGRFADVPGIQTAVWIARYNNVAYPEQQPSKDTQAVTSNNPLCNASHWEEDSHSWIYSIALHLQTAQPIPQVLSISYGIAEQLANQGFHDTAEEAITGGYAGYINATEVQLIKLAALGVSVIVSSGNNGANGDGNTACLYTNAYPSSLYVSWPASSPYVTAVGATELDDFVSSISEANTPWCGMASGSLPSGFGYDSSLATPFQLQCVTNGTEVAAGRGFRSGGGFSRYYAQPSWQSAAVAGYLSRPGVSLPYQDYFDTSKRAVPDVAMYGAGIGVVMGSNVIVTGGTDLAAPLFAVIVSLLNQVSINANGSTLGFLNPLLYYMAANVSGTFKDITSGDNRMTEECIVSSTCSGANPCGCAGCQGFTATTGWDPVTGLGSPVYSRMAAYVQQLAQPTQRPSSSSSTAGSFPVPSNSSSNSSISSSPSNRSGSSTVAASSVSSSATSSPSRSSSTGLSSSSVFSSSPISSSLLSSSLFSSSVFSSSLFSSSLFSSSLLSSSPASSSVSSSVFSSSAFSSSAGQSSSARSSSTASSSTAPSSTAPSSSPAPSVTSTTPSSSAFAPLSFQSSSSSPDSDTASNATALSTSSSSSDHKGAIIGGVVGGVVALLLCLCLLLLLLSRRQKANEGAPIDDRRELPAQRPSEWPVVSPQVANSPHWQSPHSPASPSVPAARPVVPPRPSWRPGGARAVGDPYAEPGAADPYAEEGADAELSSRSYRGRAPAMVEMHRYEGERESY